MSYSVYCLCDDECKVVYVGSSINLESRLNQHIMDNKVFSRVFYLEYESEQIMLEKEKSFISKFIPDYNRKIYSGVLPNEDDVEWLELPQSLFIHRVNCRLNQKDEDSCWNIYYQIHRDVMKLRFLYSRKVKVAGKPVRIGFNPSDKILYSYIKQMFDVCRQTGVYYTENRAEIAEATGLTSKTVDRFISKMRQHGFVEYRTNNAGNRAIYLDIADLI